jgi:hypothetical protein
MAEDFLRRWSRLKHEHAGEKPAEEPVERKEAEAPPAPLPPVDKLTPDSDFTGFMQPKVDDALRRAALKKLFNDPHFNIPDPFEAYSGDFTVGEPIPPEMLATLNQAKTLLFDKQHEPEKKEQAEAQEKIEEKPEDKLEEKPKLEEQADEPRRQDA